VFQDALERVHHDFGRELQAFQGDSAPFERVRHPLESCLVTQFRDRGPKSYRGWIAGAAAAAVLLLTWGGLTFRERQRWNSYVDRLRDEPGIVVTSTGRRAGRFFVAGLRDARAVDPAALVAASNLAPESVEGRWEPYQSLSPRFVAARARDLLRPPAGVTLDFRDGVLTATGPATDRWLVDSERLALAIAGVDRFAYAGKTPFTRAKETLEAANIQFPKGSSRLTPGQERSLGQLADALHALNEVARARGERARVEVVGHTDTDGSDVANGPLSVSRAQAVKALLPAQLEAVDLPVRGVGSAAPLSSGKSEADMSRNRRVSFRVELAGAADGVSARP
jgi:OOP family OmpA-OmpF porin